MDSFTLHFGLKYEIIYQLDAIEYCRAERTQINTQLHQVGKLFHILRMSGLNL